MSDPINCRSLKKEDDEAVRLLVKATLPLFSKEKFWDWKYLQNPHFNRSLAAVAENNGKIVGCNHWLPRRMKLSNSITVDAMLGASIAVAPEYRKRGVGTALIHFLRSQHRERKLALMYMFADPELRKHFHAPVAGYVPAPKGTVLYTRILNWDRVKTNVAAFNEKLKLGEFGDRLASVHLIVAFKSHGAPPLCFCLSDKGVQIDSSTRDAQVTVSSDMAVFNRIRSGQSLRGLVWPMLKGQLRLRGSVRKMWVAYRNLWVFREILSKKMT